MTAQPDRPCHPVPRPPGRHAARQAGCGPPAAAGQPAAALSVPADVVYGIGRIDASGRVADRAVTGALGWRGGDRLTLTAEAGRGDRPPRPGRHGHRAGPAYIAIPAALRRRCGLRAGDRVLLAAVPGQDTLAAYSFAVVDQALRAHGPFPHAAGGQP